uniref:Sorting nexin n=1 Tax=Brugia malayi TaxID=6279 RepID=A0A0J9XZ67_BRUMA|nr:BMA-SNX-6 [Brugia malayi]
MNGKGETTMVNPLDLLSSDEDVGKNDETSTSLEDGDALDERTVSLIYFIDEQFHRTEEINVDLSKDNSLIVDISDALSEKDKVKYTVHTRTTLLDFSKNEVSVVREHEEFIWLHTCLEENEAYAGFIIPPAPPRPDFDASREKLQRLGEGESTMTKDEFLKMKQELEQEYLATFKKTVAMHEVFLCRLAAHPVLRNDPNFRIFLEYEQDLSVRSRNKKELVGSFWKRLTQSADEVLLSGQKDVDDFFEHERNYLVEYYTHVKEASSRCDRISRLRKNIADSYARIGSCLEKMALQELDRDLQKDLVRRSLTFEKLKKHESRVATDEELKLGDTLQYYMKDTDAAKDLLYRRMRCLANYEGANKTLERARGRNKDIPRAEAEQSEACKKFEDISEVAKGELLDLKKRRLTAFKKNLTDLADLQIKHAKKLTVLLSNLLQKNKYFNYS